MRVGAKDAIDVVTNGLPKYKLAYEVLTTCSNFETQWETLLNPVSTCI